MTPTGSPESDLSGSDVVDVREPSWSRRLHLGVVAWLLAELAIGVVFRNTDHLAGKGMVLRAAFYPLCAVVVPAGWALRRRRVEVGASRPETPFPHLAAALLVTPFALDIGGNLVGLFDVDHFDDVLHALNWFILVLGTQTLLLRTATPRLTLVALGVGTSATAIVAWEIVEYLVSESGTTGLQLTYEDTIFDLAESFLGGCCGAFVAATRPWTSLIRTRPL